MLKLTENMEMSTKLQDMQMSIKLQTETATMMNSTENMKMSTKLQLQLQQWRNEQNTCKWVLNCNCSCNNDELNRKYGDEY